VLPVVNGAPIKYIRLASERAAWRDYLRGNALMRRFFDVFLFEDLPASDNRADDVYSGSVRK